MPSTIGHIIAGGTIAWAFDARVAARRGSENGIKWGGLTLVCAAIAAAPDLDLLVNAHRAYTHSIGATFVVALFAAAIAARRQLPIARIAFMCAAAHASHILLDWLAVDRWAPYGIQAFWPFSHHFFISGLNWFPETERRHFFSEEAIRTNALAVAQEVLILGPLAWATWLIRVKPLTGLSAQMPRGDQATE